MPHLPMISYSDDNLVITSIGRHRVVIIEDSKQSQTMIRISLVKGRVLPIERRLGALLIIEAEVLLSRRPIVAMARKAVTSHDRTDIAIKINHGRDLIGLPVTCGSCQPPFGCGEEPGDQQQKQ